MAHPAQQQFCESVKALFPQYFTGTTVVDFGSLDINGSNRGLFHNCTYIGVDLGPGSNVNVMSPAHLVPLANGSIDVLVSTECLEHDKFWRLTLKKAYDLLKPNGLFFFSCATTSRPEHGTYGSDTGSSPYTLDYYQNLTEADIRMAYAEQFGKPIEELFNPLALQTNASDFYFWGIKV